MTQSRIPDKTYTKSETQIILTASLKVILRFILGILFYLSFFIYEGAIENDVVIISNWNIIMSMEITHATFQKLCPLLQTHGYKINGGTKTGFMLINKYKTALDANNHIRSVCFSCEYYTKGNCKPEVETGTPTAEIYTEIG